MEKIKNNILHDFRIFCPDCMVLGYNESQLVIVEHKRITSSFNTFCRRCKTKFKHNIYIEKKKNITFSTIITTKE